MLPEVLDNPKNRIKTPRSAAHSLPKTPDEARWTISRSRGNLPCHLILAVSVERRFSAVWEDHLKQCH